MFWKSNNKGNVASYLAPCQLSLGISGKGNRSSNSNYLTTHLSTYIQSNTSKLEYTLSSTKGPFYMIEDYNDSLKSTESIKL